MRRLRRVVLVAVVLDRDSQVGIRKVDTRDEASVCSPDLVLHRGAGKTLSFQEA